MMPEDAQIPINTRVLDRLVPGVPDLSEFIRERFRDPQHGKFGEERQQEPQVIQVMRADGAARDEPCGEFAEGHRGIRLDDLKSLDRSIPS